MRNRQLQRWCNSDYELWISDYGFNVPTASFNAVYQLCHIYRHLFDEGIGLRQLLDYYFVLRTLHTEQDSLSPALPRREEERMDHGQSMDSTSIAVKSNEEIMHTLGQFGMKRFAGAMMYVLQTVFAMPDEYLICQPNEKEGRFLLSEILQAGNFGAFDQRIRRDYRLRINDCRWSLPRGMAHAIEKTKHNMRLVWHYPEEVMWEPFFRVYH